MGKNYSPFEIVRLLASGVRATAATVTGDAVDLLEGFETASGAVFVLDLTDAKAAVGDTLDIYIQAKLDDANWIDIVHFTQILGNGSDDLTYVAKVSAPDTLAMFEVGTALTSGNLRNLLAGTIRYKYILVDGGAHGQSFTFSISAIVLG